MKKNMINTENIEGRLYDHTLELKNVQNKNSENFGKEFINGEVSVATDEEGLNVITVHYTYVTEFTKNGTASPTYQNLKRIMAGKTWTKDGKDAAMMVKLVPSVALNDFYPQGKDELVSQMRNEGGFVNIVSYLNDDERARRKFTFDVVITAVDIIEREGQEDIARIKAATFNFRNDLLPVTLVAKDSIVPGSVAYFMSLDASPNNPIFTKVWGEIINTTVKVERTVESAFGAPTVDVSQRQQREWVVTGAQPIPYVFGLDETITVEDLTKAIADRNVYLEGVKTRAKEYYANKAASTTASAIPAPNPMPAPAANVPVGNFNF